MSELGKDAGFFAKHGVDLEILYTEGGGQTQQAVISGSVDIGIGVGTYGVMGAFAKGAPLRIIGNSMTGAHDLYWYVKADSPVKSACRFRRQVGRLLDRRLLDQPRRARACSACSR